MDRNNKGFTLVELLAVIVILAIIMIIAIPAVLDTVNKAQRKTFAEYVEKIYKTGQERFLLDSELGSIPRYDVVEYVYDITEDLGLDTTGNYKGAFIVTYCTGMTAERCFGEGHDVEGPYLYSVILYDDNNFYYDTLDRGALPSDEQIHSISEFPSELSNLLKEYTAKQIYFNNEMKRVCATKALVDAHDYSLYDIVRQKPDAWDYGYCEEPSDYISPGIF